MREENATDHQKTMRPWPITLCLLASLAVLADPCLAVQGVDDDVVVFLNGDRLTGEVKSLERGKLRFKTAATDTISIEWDDVASLSSDQDIQVETEAGVRHLGHLSAVSEDRQVVVQTKSGPVHLNADHIVIMAPIEKERIERIDGDISAGYNFTKASDVEQAQIALNLESRTETRIYSFDMSSARSDSEDNDSSQRASANLAYTRLRPNRWMSGVVGRLDNNDELGLDLRASVGAGIGRYLRQTQDTTLSLFGGLQVNREKWQGDQSDETTVEAFGALTWDWFRYDTPELDLSTDLLVFPNLSDAGRVRAELEISLKWEMIEDLFWQLSFYDSYDSDPSSPDPDVENNDYGVSTSLGWEF